MARMKSTIWKKISLSVISLILYGLAVSPVYAGEAILSWDPPTTNVDGTSLTDLAGYKIYYGTTSGSYGTSVNVGNVAAYTVTNLSPSGTYYFAVTAYDSSGNESGYSNEVLKTIPASTTDTIPPVISGITNSVSAMITWTTDETSTSQVEYGTTASYGSSTTLDSTLITSHSVTLSGLSAGTTYHFRVISRDAAGNATTSGDFTLTTSSSDTSGTYIEEWGNTPTSNHSGTVEDTYLNLDSTNYSTLTRLNTYTWPTGSVANAILMKWNLSAIPAGAAILDATLSLYLEGYAGTGGDALYDIPVHKVIQKDSVISLSSGYTYDGLNGWTSSTGTYNNVPLAQGDIAPAEDTRSIDKTLGYKSWSVAQMVQEWVNNPGTNYGLLLNSDPSAATDSSRYFSSNEHSTGNQRPKLVITYILSGTSTDTSTPVISSVTTGNLSANGAAVTWTTNEASTSQVEYGTTTSYGFSTTLSSTLVTSHSITLSGLSAWTTYHFRVKSRDAVGNLSTSSDLTFTTLAPPDTTPPTGTISINSGAVYTTTTTVTLTLSCSDTNTGCSQMQFSNNGTSWSSLENYDVGKSWTLTTGDGNKTVYVRYQDNAGNVSSPYSDAVTLDSTAPVISGITPSNITDSAATIIWTTSESATAQVEYGTSSTLGSLSLKDSGLKTSHSITLTGLSSNMTYHYRVTSVDGAGNAATSIENIFLTLPPAPPDQPAAVSDLHVRPGASTRNSVAVEWTATGADGNIGTASSYDLRMSKSRIIDDGLTPVSGEVAFSNATQVGGVSVPQTAGTLQFIQINGLETNTAYYFAIKAIDDKGNQSPLSNVVNGNNIPPLPVTAVRQGYTMISFPMVPATSDVQTLLSGIVGSPVELYSWSSSGFGDPNSAFVVEQNVVPGYGYFLKTDRSNAVLNITGSPVTDLSRAIPLQPGWNMIGNPYPADVSLKNSQVRNVTTGEVMTFEQAVISGWVGNAIYPFNGSTYSFIPYTDAVLQIWQGYWVAVLQNGFYELVISKP